LLLSTLGESGMLLCRRHAPPLHIPTVAREVFDVSGAGDTVIASFTLAIAAERGHITRGQRVGLLVAPALPGGGGAQGVQQVQPCA
jgi:D-beta-D-heptose 7-phosphate kinase/D-beta-D-heptose 1-phosphate adenosyltransferase